MYIYSVPTVLFVLQSDGLSFSALFLWLKWQSSGNRMHLKNALQVVHVDVMWQHAGLLFTKVYIWGFYLSLILKEHHSTGSQIFTATKDQMLELC